MLSNIPSFTPSFTMHEDTDSFNYRLYLNNHVIFLILSNIKSNIYKYFNESISCEHNCPSVFFYFDNFTLMF